MGKVDFSQFDGMTRIALEEIERRLVGLEKRKPQNIVQQQSAPLNTDELFRKLAPKFYDMMLSKFPWLSDKISSSLNLSSYFYLPGRSGGQTAIGGTGSGDDLTLQTTSNATKGDYIFSEMTTAGYLKNTAAGVVTGGNDFSPAYPVGSVYISTDSTNPGTLLGLGTWGSLGNTDFGGELSEAVYVWERTA